MSIFIFWIKHFIALSGLSVSDSSKSVSSSSGGSSSGKSDSVTQNNSIAESAMLCDLGWSQFVVAWFAEGNSLNNCTLTIDGIDVTSAFTPVTDDGSIVKWEIKNLNPAKLVAKCEDKTQEIASYHKVNNFFIDFVLFRW